MSDHPFGKRGAQGEPPAGRNPEGSEGPTRPRGPSLPDARLLVVTTNDLPGYRILEYLGVARGITVRSRSVVGTFVGGVQSLFGGQIGAFQQLAEQARSEAYDHLSPRPA